MKNKKIFCALFSIILLLVSTSAVSYAFENDVHWTYDESTKTIYISGTGAMQDYDNEYSCEWAAYMNSIAHVVVEEGITSVGSYSFSGAVHLSSVSLAQSVTAIGANAFSACPELLSLTLPPSITKIADSSFAYNGKDKKSGFIINVKPASYALNFAVDNQVDFSCESMQCGLYDGTIYPAGMTAYYPYTPKVNGTFKFYSKSKLDTLGAIYDSDFNQLNSNDDYDGSDFCFEQKLEKDKTYYIALNLFSSRISGTYQIAIEPVSYTVNAKIYAMKSPKNEPSEILLNGAVVNGTKTDGTFTLETTKPYEEIAVTYGYASEKFILSPDKDSTLSLMVCDLNNDRIVNGIDYAMMKKSYSPFLSLFSDFADYRY